MHTSPLPVLSFSEASGPLPPRMLLSKNLTVTGTSRIASAAPVQLIYFVYSHFYDRHCITCSISFQNKRLWENNFFCLLTDSLFSLTVAVGFVQRLWINCMITEIKSHLITFAEASWAETNRASQDGEPFHCTSYSHISLFLPTFARKIASGDNSPPASASVDGSLETSAYQAKMFPYKIIPSYISS